MLRNPQQVTANSLVNAGIAVRKESGGVQLAPDTEYSLLLERALPTVDADGGRADRRYRHTGPVYTPVR